MTHLSIKACLWVGLLFLSVVSTQAQPKWTAAIGFHQDKITSTRNGIHYGLHPELQLERRFGPARRAINKVSLTVSTRQFQAENTNFFWRFDSVAESYEMKNLLLGIGWLTQVFPKSPLQPIIGGRFLFGIPLEWQYEMERSSSTVFLPDSSTPGDISSWPDHATTNRGLELEEGFQICFGLQQQIGTNFHLRALWAMGNSWQSVRYPFSFSTSRRQSYEKGLRSRWLSLALAYDW